MTITPEKVAAAACERVGGWNESLAAALSVTAEGNVLSFEVTRWADDEEGTETVCRFRAPVVPADAGPFVVASPELLAAVRALYRSHVAAGSLPTDQAATLAHEAQEALLALSPDQMAVLAEDAAEDVRAEHPADEPLIDPDCRDGKCGSCIGGPCEHDCHRQAEQDGDGDA